MKTTHRALFVFVAAVSASPLAGCFSDYSTDCTRNPALDCFWGGGGDGGGGGSTTTTTTTEAPKCGDSHVDPGEACDDGNTADCDDCRGDCSAKEAGCGDGFSCLLEECDEGPANSDMGSCTTMCKLPACGDGFQQPNEECDDGNTTGGDNCSPDCKVECVTHEFNGAVFYDKPASRCYLRVTTQKRAWSSAQNECKTWYPKATLVAFSSVEEASSVAAALPATSKAWTGGNDSDALGTFVWSNGEPFPSDQSMWAGGQPSLEADQRCVSADKDYLLSDDNCATLLGFICELDMNALHVQ